MKYLIYMKFHFMLAQACGNISQNMTWFIENT